jgi:galactan endo-1,6-beta-galactosidase
MLHEAFNEASSDWWKSGGTQEGCHISSEVQQKVIEYLRSELDKRGLHNTIISASDENSYDLAITVWNSSQKVKSSERSRVSI